MTKENAVPGNGPKVLSNDERAVLLRLYETINGPVQAGPMWVKYRRATAEAMLDVLKQVLVNHGVEFRPISEPAPGGGDHD